jgi:hypothetical protein
MASTGNVQRAIEIKKSLRVPVPVAWPGTKRIFLPDTKMLGVQKHFKNIFQT